MAELLREALQSERLLRGAEKASSMAEIVGADSRVARAVFIGKAIEQIGVPTVVAQEQATIRDVLSREEDPTAVASSFARRYGEQEGSLISRELSTLTNK